MGTFYYYQSPERNRCPHCGRFDGGELRCIGESHNGWAFALYVTDELYSLDAWQARWKIGGIIWKDQNHITLAELIREITVRQASINISGIAPGFVEELLAVNEAVIDEHGLWRRRIGFGGCVDHGSGPWDLVRDPFGPLQSALPSGWRWR